MKTRLLLGIVMVLLVSLSAFAQIEEEEEVPWEDMDEEAKFEADPQKAYEEDPTAANLERHEVPKNVENFKRLDEEQQGFYLIKNYRADFAQEYLKGSKFDNVDSKSIASIFFSEQPQNVNNNKEVFQKYAASEGIYIEVKGNIRSYSMSGFLVGANQQINLMQFKDKYSFEVDEAGNIILLKEEDLLMYSSHTFTGNIKKGNDGNIELESGSLDGRSVVNGRSIRITKKGHIEGTAEEIGGVRFFRPEKFKLVSDGFISSSMEELPLLYLNDATIKSLSSDSNLVIAAQDVLLTEGSYDKSVYIKKGKVGVRDGQPYIPDFYKAIVDRFEVEGTGSDVGLFLDGFEHSLDSEVYFSIDATEGRLAAGSLSILPGEETKVRNVKIKPLPGNLIFDVEDNDLLSFGLSAGSSLEADKLMPDINPRVVVSGAGRIDIENGYFDFVVDETGFQRLANIEQMGSIFERIKQRKGSVPLTLEGTGADGKLLFGTEREPKKMIFTNYQDHGSIPATLLESEVAEPRGFAKLLFSERMYGSGTEFNVYTNPRVVERGVTIEGAGDLEGKNLMEELSPDERRDLLGLISYIPEDIWKTKKIFIYSDEYWKEEGGMEGTGGYALMDEKEIHIPLSAISSIKDVLLHEGLHTWHPVGSSWDEAWKKIDGPYDIDRGELGPAKITIPIVGIVLERYTTGWGIDTGDGTHEPRYGHTRPYTSNNQKESVADTAGFIIKNPRDYARLIDQKSRFYREREGNVYATGIMDDTMARKWSDTYLAKLYLYQEAGILTTEQIKAVWSHVSDNNMDAVKNKQREISKRLGDVSIE